MLCIKRTVILILAVTLSLFAWTPYISLASAASSPPSTTQSTGGDPLPPYVGRICIVPEDSLACPQTLQAMRLDSSGHLTVSINILNSTIFDAFSIYVSWDPTVINSTGTFLTNMILLNTTFVHRCVNNLGFACGSHDGIGIEHLEVVGANTTAPAAGRLFQLTFTGVPFADPRIGFTPGCSTVSIGALSAPGSVPNTDLCVVVGIISTTICSIVCIETLTPVPEGIQSQSLGVHLPTPLASVIPAGNITGILTAGSAPNYADTWIMPYPITLPGNLTSWKAQFRPLFLSSLSPAPSTPTTVQIKVLRHISPTVLIVVEAGPLHDPRAVLQSRLPSYPYVLTESTVIEYFTDTLLTVLSGDLIGLTITSDTDVGAYTYPYVNGTGDTRVVTRNVPLNGTIDLSDIFTGTFPGAAPALEVSIQPSPPTLDTSGDGIPDFVALSPEMRALGVDPCRKNVPVQLDYMVPASGAYTHRPLQQALDIVTSAFDAAPVPAVSDCPYAGFPTKTSGINLIIDVKNAIPQQDVLNFTHSEPQSFDTLKAAYLDPNRVHYFRYGLFVNNMIAGRSTSGVGETFGSNFIVSLGAPWTNNVGTVNEQAGTLMHELGHVLGLSHGGSDDLNFKPNYLSVMNYEHQVVGIVSKTPTGDVTRFDYSREALPNLNETNLNEWNRLSSADDYTRWVCPDHHTKKIDLLSNNPDWTCDGRLDTSVTNDLNNDTLTGALTGYDDWANLRFKFTESDNFNTGCRIECDIGCRVGCDIGCRVGCDIGTELDFETAQVIEAEWAAFLASPHGSSSTSVDCVPSTVVVNTSSSCKATVTDSAAGTPPTPTGTVSFQSSQQGSFSPTTCSLTGTGAFATCTVNYSPGINSVGSQTITSGYTGDINHLGSNGSTTVNGLTLPVTTLTVSTTLTSDLTGRIVIAADNVTLNCNGHTIQGITTDQVAGTYPGILLNGGKNVLVQNCHVTNFYVGIQLLSSTKNMLMKNNAEANGYGFILSSSNQNKLLLNNATSNIHDGFRLESSNLNLLVGNRAENNLGSGFLLISSSTNILSANSANGNAAYGFALTSYSNMNKVLGNTACMNRVFDAYQDTTSFGNAYNGDRFCTTRGIPPRSSMTYADA